MFKTIKLKWTSSNRLIQWLNIVLKVSLNNQNYISNISNKIDVIYTKAPPGGKQYNKLFFIFVC